MVQQKLCRMTLNHKSVQTQIEIISNKRFYEKDESAIEIEMKNQ